MAYARLVDAYTERTLSVDSDAARAVAGILNKISDETGENFVYGLLGENIVSCLLWEGYRSRRRPFFPSWTWLGWQGNARYKCWLQYEQTLTPICGRKIYKLSGVWGLFYPGYIEITCCANLVNRNDFVNSGSLVLLSSLSSFGLVLTVRDGERYLEKDTHSDPDTWYTSVGDKWELRDDAGNPISRGNVGQDILGTQNYSLEVDPQTSSRIIDAGVKKLDFLLLQRWTEVDPDDFGSKKSECYGDRVWLMALLQNPDGTAERAGILTLPYDCWLAAHPRDCTVCLV
jgi:hypothetical protein